MTSFMGFRGLSAVGGLLLSFVGGSSVAQAQAQPSVATTQNFKLAALPAGPSAVPVQPTTVTPSLATDARLPLVDAVLRATSTGSLDAAALPPRAVFQPSAPIGPIVVMHGLSPALDASNPGMPLAALVDANSVGELDEEASCLATAVYFESKGEPLEGQLAVAQVVINRSLSGRFPATLCGVVKQHAQFSFVRGGAFPRLNANCPAWRKAQAIARIAQKHLMAALPANVLWYHADYVAPRWRAALIEVQKIGQHIFYRA